MTAENKLAKTEKAEVQRRERQEVYYQPATDIRESSDAMMLTFDMPGVAKDDVELTIDRDTLTVTGRAAQEESGRALYRETNVGDYRRHFSLPEDVSADQVTAGMKAGVLTVTIAKPEKAKPKRIAITAGE